MNIKDISSKFRSERQVRAVLGLTSEQFFILLPIFEKQINLKKEAAGKNKIKPNNGQHGALKSASDKLFFTCCYLKCYESFDKIGFDFDRSGSSAHTWLSKLLPLLTQSLADLDVLPATEFKNPKEMRLAFKDIETLIIDATERLIQRPQDIETQKKL